MNCFKKKNKITFFKKFIYLQAQHNAHSPYQSVQYPMDTDTGSSSLEHSALYPSLGEYMGLKLTPDLVQDMVPVDNQVSLFFIIFYIVSYCGNCNFVFKYFETTFILIKYFMKICQNHLGSLKFLAMLNFTHKSNKNSFTISPRKHLVLDFIFILQIRLTFNSVNSVNFKVNKVFQKALCIFFDLISLYIYRKSTCSCFCTITSHLDCFLAY